MFEGALFAVIMQHVINQLLSSGLGLWLPVLTFERRKDEKDEGGATRIAQNSTSYCD